MIKKGVEYKDVSCVYCIQNKINGKRYIGQTKFLYKRSHQYSYAFRMLQKGGHLNDHLLNAVRKYGEDAFEMFVVELCSVDVLYEREAYWIKFYDTLNRDCGYNLRMDVGGRMVTHPETSEKIRNNLKTQWANGVRDGHAEKLKQSWETRDKQAQSALMTQNLTKYLYIVVPVGDLDEEFVFDYQGLVELGINGVIGALSKAKQGVVKFKGAFVKRVDFKEYIKALEVPVDSNREF